jgi:hypothetical protein
MNCPWHAYYGYVRDSLELLYYIAGIAIAIAAYIGLKQISLTKRIAESNATRESVKLAADQCKYFAEVVVPALTRVVKEYQDKKLTFLSVTRNFKVHNLELVEATNFDVAAIGKELGQIPIAIEYLNFVEAFAIPFAAGVATDDIGFRETAVPFCVGVFYCLPILMYLRITQQVNFPSIMTLFSRWLTRLAKEQMETWAKQLKENLKNMGGPNVPPEIGTKL